MQGQGTGGPPDRGSNLVLRQALRRPVLQSTARRNSCGQTRARKSWPSFVRRCLFGSCLCNEVYVETKPGVLLKVVDLVYADDVHVRIINSYQPSSQFQYNARLQVMQSLIRLALEGSSKTRHALIGTDLKFPDEHHLDWCTDGKGVAGWQERTLSSVCFCEQQERTSKASWGCCDRPEP